ncbi:MAG: diguanylate cyclase [Deltaproteobacteria bacterium]|nr:diguanylate cyclase [Deltaproteobacteria bacterium]
MDTQGRILILASSATERSALRAALADAELELAEASTAAEAFARVEAEPFNLCLFAADLPDAGPAAVLRGLEERTRESPLSTIALAAPSHVARLLNLGADDVVARLAPAEELRARVLSRLRCRARLETLRRERDELARLAITDPLTGLYNPRHLRKRLDEEFRRTLRYGQPLALLIIDLDRFKRINDTFGHPVGDAVLRHVSGVLQNALRTTDLLARQGGEEFAAVLPQTARAGADLVARRLGAALEQSPYLLRGHPPLSITASIGVSHAPAAGVSSPDDLVAAADEALYRAKRAGRNQVALAKTARPRSRGGRRVGPN